MSKASNGIGVALVGLGFGAAFLPIYLRHPEVRKVVVCDRDEERAREIGKKFDVTSVVDLDDVLGSDEIDAVHLVTPMPDHATQSLQVLNAGKHCACAVPMGLSIDELRMVVEKQRESELVYMMMETAVYTREFLFVQNLLDSGEFGQVQFMRGDHYSAYERWPRWKWHPPMHYATHAVAPLLALMGARASKVNCRGSGTIRPELNEPFRAEFPAQTAVFELDGTNVAAEVTRIVFDTAREEREGFCVYGHDATFEWRQTQQDSCVLFRSDRGRESGSTKSRSRQPLVVAERPSIPDGKDPLPTSLMEFTRGGHGGSHPRLVHEFVTSITERRSPSVDAVTAADWTAAGVCAHLSALAGGETVEVPRFDLQ